MAKQKKMSAKGCCEKPVDKPVKDKKGTGKKRK